MYSYDDDYGFKRAGYALKLDLSSIKKQLSKNINTKKIGKLISSYTDGRVYDYDKDRVIKISGPWTDSKYRKNFLNLLKKVHEQKPSCVVRVFDYGQLKNGAIWYIMKRLKSFKYTYKLECTITDIEDTLYNGKWNDGQYHRTKRRYKSAQKVIQKLQNYNQKYLDFAYNLYNFKFIYYDLQTSNVCKDSRGKLKLIDLESFVFPYLAARNKAYS